MVFFPPYWTDLLFSHLFIHLKKTALGRGISACMCFSEAFWAGAIVFTTVAIENHSNAHDLFMSSHFFYTQQKLLQRIVLYFFITVRICGSSYYVCVLLWICLTDRWSLFITNKLYTYMKPEGLKTWRSWLLPLSKCLCVI